MMCGREKGLVGGGSPGVVKSRGTKSEIGVFWWGWGYFDEVLSHSPHRVPTKVPRVTVT